jgi:UDP-GlcNAc:undecaprenyl-phosphate GlcNAc-1-phosphate transferase
MGNHELGIRRILDKIALHAFIGIFLVFLAYPLTKAFYFDSGLRWQYILIFSFLATYFLTPLCRFAALRLNILDRPDWRKIHRQPTPLLGGIGIYVAFSTSLLLNGVFLPGMKIVLFGATLVFIMGLWDDIRPLPAIVKLILQILISTLVVVWGDIKLTFFFQESWAPVFNVPLTVLWIVGLTNAMNFFDGIDGLASGMCVITSLFLGLIAFKTGQVALGWFAIALLGACMGFLPHNLRFGKPARIFLGDAGSTFLGFTLSGLAVMGKWSNTSHFVSLSAPVLIFGVLIFDMIYVNLSRIKNGQARSFSQLLTCVNTDHLHHRLLSLGFTPKEVLFVVLTMSTCLGFSALIIMNQNLIEAILGLFQATLIIALIVTLMHKGRERIPKEGDRRVMRRRRQDRVEIDNPQ